MWIAIDRDGRVARWNPDIRRAIIRIDVQAEIPGGSRFARDEVSFDEILVRYIACGLA